MEGGETPAVLTSLLALSELSAAVHLSVKMPRPPQQRESSIASCRVKEEREKKQECFLIPNSCFMGKGRRWLRKQETSFTQMCMGPALEADLPAP